MNNELKDFLKNIIIVELGVNETNWENHLEEYLTDLDSVEEKTIVSLRWYDEIERIVSLQDKFIKYKWYRTHGDDIPADLGLKLNINTIKEVFKKEKLITKIYYED